MAHSTDKNAGQKLASARKRGESMDVLKTLKSAVSNRKHTGDVTPEDRAAIRDRIAAVNREYRPYR